MSAKSEFKIKDGARSHAYRKELKKLRTALNEKLLNKAKNHVSEDDKSPGGFPFHFSGPSKKDTNAGWKKWDDKKARNQRKRARQKLAS